MLYGAFKTARYYKDKVFKNKTWKFHVLQLASNNIKNKLNLCYFKSFFIFIFISLFKDVKNSNSLVYYIFNKTKDSEISKQ